MRPLIILFSVAFSVNICNAEILVNQDCNKKVVSMINNSKNTIQIAVYSINENNIKQAIDNAKERGVVINIVSDKVQSSQKHHYCHNNDKCLSLRGRYGRGYMHHKFAIFDNQVAIMGSFNWTNGGSYVNSEDCVVIDKKEDIAVLQGKFEGLLK